MSDACLALGHISARSATKELESFSTCMSGRFFCRVAASKFALLRHFYSASARSEKAQFADWALSRHSLRLAPRSAMAIFGSFQFMGPDPRLVEPAFAAIK
jgi:hypothetical protein